MRRETYSHQTRAEEAIPPDARPGSEYEGRAPPHVAAFLQQPFHLPSPGALGAEPPDARTDVERYRFVGWTPLGRAAALARLAAGCAAQRAAAGPGHALVHACGGVSG